MAAAAYIERAPEFTIENGVACVRAQSGGKELCWHLPLFQFRIAVANAARMLAEHDAAGKVIMVPKMRLGKQK